MNDLHNRFTIGYFNQILSSEWSLLPWKGMVQAARKNSTDLISFHGNSIRDNIGFNAQANIVYDLARGKKLDGIITWKGAITWCITDKEVSDFCRRYNIPVITIEGSLKGYPCVTYGNYIGMSMIVKHLVDTHGYKKIGYMGLVDNHIGFQERFRGYKETMKDYGINVDPELVKSWVSWIPTIDGRPKNEVLDTWLKDVIISKVEAIIGACDPISLWIMERLENLGVNVPDDIAVVGFDGFTESRITNPPLTTINPSWTELGKVAFDRMIDVLNGKSVPDKTIVPANIVIGRTCGCLEENVSFAGSKPVKQFIFLPVKEKIINDMEAVLTGKLEENIKQIMENLIEVFINEIKGKNKNKFLKELDLLLRKSFNERKEIVIWQDVISVFQKYIYSLFNRRKFIEKANILCNQARILISNTIYRLQGRQRLDIEERINEERHLGMNLTTIFEQEELMDLIAEKLPKLGISECYISLYEEPKTYRYPDQVSEYSRLVLAYNKKGRRELDQKGLRFPSHEIIPNDMWEENNVCNYFVKPLYFRENQIGFVVFQADLLIDNFYNFLSGQISSGLQGTFLIKQINEHSEILESGIEDLSSSIEEIVKTVEGISNSIVNQDNAVNEEAASIEEMKVNITNITNMSNNSKTISNDLNNIASEGVKSVKKIIDSIQDIELKSQNIYELLSLIQDIADHTKLLGFNATVEAARAGEKGKGFYVVAKEVSKLAEDVNNSVKGIEEILKMLMTKISESAEISRKTVSGLDNIIDNSHKNLEISNQLNLAMIEQEKGSDDILQTTNKIVNITSEIKIAISEQMLTIKEFKSALIKLQNITKSKG